MARETEAVGTRYPAHSTRFPEEDLVGRSDAARLGFWRMPARVSAALKTTRSSSDGDADRCCPIEDHIEHIAKGGHHVVLILRRETGWDGEKLRS